MSKFDDFNNNFNDNEIKKAIRKGKRNRGRENQKRPELQKMTIHCIIIPNTKDKNRTILSDRREKI